jgi:hypothetical protein
MFVFFFFFAPKFSALFTAISKRERETSVNMLKAQSTNNEHQQQQQHMERSIVFYLDLLILPSPLRKEFIKHHYR